MDTVLDTNVLMLNRVFQVVSVTTVRHAFSLFFKGAAKAVLPDYTTCAWEDWADIPAQPEMDDVIRTVSRYIRVPRVIALTRYDKVPRRELRFSRHSIYTRDNGRCQYCRHKFPTSELSLDHVIPLSRGGKSSWDNVVASCVPCNTRKGDRLLAECGMKLIAAPKKPRPQVIGKELHVEWKNFLDAVYWNVPIGDLK